MVTLYSIFQDFIKQTKIYIQNVLPKKVSELTNDVGYITSHQDISGKQDKLTFDTTPTTSSSNPVTSGGIKTALDNKLNKTGNAVSATKLQAARTLSLTGKAAGSATFDGSANASINVTSVNADTASKLSTARKINITGNATGAAAFDGSGDISISTTVNESKHAVNADVAKVIFGFAEIDSGNWGHSTGTFITGFHEKGGGAIQWRAEGSSLYEKIDGTFWQREGMYEVIDTSTVNNYAPTKTGGGASGTWDINITGTATKAIQDASGNVITDTYAKKTDVTGAGYITKATLIASLPVYYGRSAMWSAAKNIITVPDYITVNIGNNGYVKTGASTIDVNTASNWDNSTYATSANRAGKDFYIYACQGSGTVPKFVLSANSTVPSGYTATNSRKIGGFHCECADVGTIDGHPLSGYIAGDILPRSIWDLKHRPVSSPEGMVWCDGVWVDIYLAGWDGSKLVSQYKAVIQDGDSTKKWHGELFNEEFHKIKKRLLWRDEFAAYAKGSNEKTNIAGSFDPNTTGGHKDTANRRMISNYGLEDCCGVLWQWMNDISMRGIVTNGTDSDYASSSNYWLNGYGWDSANRIGNSDIDGNKTKYGNEYGLLVRLLAGGFWADGSNCGSRSVVGNYLSTGRPGDGACAGRGASEPWVG